MRIGRYELVEPLGSGGSASAWLARDGDREVALKLLDPELPRELLRDEFSRLAGLYHPHLLRVLEYEAVGARTFYTAELIERTTWTPSTWRKDRDVVIGVLRALAFLHGHGIRHGDVKPDNVMVREGAPVLIDLGCAAATGTASRTVSGTLAFMAPEVKSASSADGRADMFSLGCVLQSIDGLPATMRTLAERMRAPDVAQRPSADEVLEALKVDVVRSASLDAPRLLGRDAELRRFDALLDALVAGRRGARTIAIHGESGSGRTRLLHELRWRAQLRVTAFELHEPRMSLGERLGPRREWAHAVAAMAPTVFLVDDVDLRSTEERAALDALRRVIPESGPLLLVMVSGDAEELLEIGPLGVDDLRVWMGERAPAVHRLSGGYPREARLVLAGGEGSTLDEIRAVQVAALPKEVRRVLGLVAALGHLPMAWLEPEAEALGVAIGAGFVVRRRERVALARPVERDALRAHATKRDLRAIAKRIPKDYVAEAIVCRVAAGDDASALGRAIEPTGTPMDREAADALVQIGESGSAARLFEAMGDAPRAAELYRDAGEMRRLGACLLRLERLDDARRALKGDRSPEAADIVARVDIKQGEYAAALKRAERALGATSEASTRALLLEDVGVAASYLGEHERSETSLRAALEHATAPRARVRVLSYLAIARWRRGDLSDAAYLYTEALELAETHELDDQLAPAAINSGSIHHHRGEWGRALGLYQRGFEGARVLGQTTALATLSFNLAKLYADVGARARATHWADEATRYATECGATLLAAATETVRAELARNTDPSAALRLYDDARKAFADAGAERELLEVDVGIAETHALAGQREEAQALLETLDASSFDDVEARIAMLLAGFARDVDALRTQTESIRDRRDALAEACGVLGRLERERGETHTGDATLARARAAWLEIAEGLPEELRDSFWQHPKRVALTPQTSSHPERGKLQRLLAINNKLSSSLETAEVLHMAMDAAIELTGAERGFLVLREGDEAKVRVARNLDRERIGRSHTKLSWNLAEQVLETGEPVLTIDARDDARFRDHVSVHAMKLRSVLAVPIPSPDGVRGALYLDNRFKRGRFSEEDVELLTAFADQLAIALRNAELLETLRARTEELEKERARVEALSRGQAARIETLMAEVRSHRASAERRFDYGHLVGRSPSMRRVLDTLDRVIDSALAVLVQGESGTGKELVARAVHSQSPRKDGPFVAINCAALPETLLESELFGHVRGAFTGATNDREGLMVAADGGTLFLDELGEIPLTTQAKLLRVLETREVRPVGGRDVRAIDFRLVCATNRDLESEVSRGRFRQDLFYRVGVVRVDLPPLRQRLEDVPELCARLLERVDPDAELGPKAMQVILAYAWPGNVRQLANVLATAVVLANGATIQPRHLQLADAPSKADAADRHERDRLLDALRRFDWRVVDAAEHIGMSRATFYRRMKRHGISPRRA